MVVCLQYVASPNNGAHTFLKHTWCAFDLPRQLSSFIEFALRRCTTCCYPFHQRACRPYREMRHCCSLMEAKQCLSLVLRYVWGSDKACKSEGRAVRDAQSCFWLYVHHHFVEMTDCLKEAPLISLESYQSAQTPSTHPLLSMIDLQMFAIECYHGIIETSGKCVIWHIPSTLPAHVLVLRRDLSAPVVTH